MTTKTKTPKGAPGVTVRRNADGTFSFRSWVPAGSNGRKKFLPSKPTLAEALTLREFAMRRLDEAPVVGVTWGELEAEVLATVERRGGRPGYLRWCREHGRLVVESLGRHDAVLGLRPHVLQGIVDGWAKNLSGSTVAGRRRWLSLAIRTALRRGWVNENIVDRIEWPRVVVRRQPFLNAEGVAEVIRRVRASDRKGADLFADVVEVLACTGLRRSELARLTVADVDLDHRRLEVAGKTGTVTMQIGKTAAEVLGRLVGRAGPTPTAPLVPGPSEVARASWLNVVFKEWADRLGVAALKPHALRRAFVSTVVQHTQSLPEVMQLTRHRSAAMVARYIGEAKDRSDVLDAVGDAIRKPKGKGKTKIAGKRKHLLRRVV
ncbi:MAG: tyrosine-type recombinase/integrase [Planctomycetes bacterium]|nr:tyrosine-type recombinase/integrase [Planctomycetota bacterium]